jgi:Tol biopolymer transport system component
MKRHVPLAVACIMMVSLLTPAGAGSQTPTATPAASPVVVQSGWRVAETREINVDGEPLALSPDGQWLAGLGAEGDSICVWDVDSLAPMCAGNGLLVAPFPMTPAMVWAPDSSAVAFVDGVAQLGGPTEVMVFNVMSGELSRLTTSMPDDGSIHIGTAWTADSRRVVFSTFSTIGWIDVASGETGRVPLGDVSADTTVAWPVFIASDNSIVFRIGQSDDAEEIAGVWRVDLDGSNLTQLVAADDIAPSNHPVPLRVSSDGVFVSVASMEAVRRFDWEHALYLVDARTGEVSHLEINGSRYVLGPPIFSPDGGLALVAGGDDPETGLHMLDLATGIAHPVPGAELGISWLMKPPTWVANNSVFIPDSDGGTLITLAPAG